MKGIQQPLIYLLVILHRIHAKIRIQTVAGTGIQGFNDAEGVSSTSVQLYAPFDLHASTDGII